MKHQPSRQALAGLHDSAYRWALTCCGFDEDRSREVLQTVYLEILAGRAVFEGRSSLKTWLFAVVRRTAWRLAAEARRTQLAPAEAEPVSATDGCLDGVARAQTRALVVQALAGLPQQQRQVVELVYYHELSLSDTATVMGIALGTVRQHFHRAKQALAGTLEPIREALHEH